MKMTNETLRMALVGYEQRYAEICDQIEATKRRIQELEGTARVRVVSDKTRKAMSEAQKKRWRKRRKSGGR